MSSKIDIIEISFSSFRALAQKVVISNTIEYFDECGLYFLGLVDNVKGETCYSFEIKDKKKYLLAKLKYGI